MHFLENFYFKTLKYDLSNKFFYRNIKEIPQIEKIILSFGCKTNDLKRLSTSLLALEFITGQKGQLTNVKKPNILLKLRKGNPVGCKINLRKKRMIHFIERLIVEILPKIKNFNGLLLNKSIKKTAFNYDIKDTLHFSELEENYYLFNNLPNLKITVITKAKTRVELLFLLKSCKLPIL